MIKRWATLSMEADSTKNPNHVPSRWLRTNGEAKLNEDNRNKYGRTQTLTMVWQASMSFKVQNHEKNQKKDTWSTPTLPLGPPEDPQGDPQETTKTRDPQENRRENPETPSPLLSPPPPTPRPPREPRRPPGDLLSPPGNPPFLRRPPPSERRGEHIYRCAVLPHTEFWPFWGPLFSRCFHSLMNFGQFGASSLAFDLPQKPGNEEQKKTKKTTHRRKPR